MQVFKHIDPLVDLRGKSEWVVESSGKFFRYQAIPAQSQQSTTMTWNVICPEGPQTIIHPQIWVRANCHFSFTGVGNPLLQIDQGNDAVRWCPLNSSAESVRVTFQNTSFQSMPKRSLHAMARCYLNQEAIKRNLGPLQWDTTQEYSQATGTVGQNPLCSWIDSTQYFQGRGAQNYQNLVNGNGTASCDLVTIEPLFLSPLTSLMSTPDGVLSSGWDHQGIMGIQNFSVVMALTGSFSDGSTSWSHSSSGNTLSTISVTIDTPELIVCFITRQDTMEIPRSLSLPYYDYSTPYSTSLGTVNAGQTVNAALNAITLKTIPSHIFIFAQESENSKTVTSTDTFFAIEQVSLRIGGYSNFLDTATPEQLYDISVQNGYCGQWNDWICARGFGMGSVLAIDMVKNLGIPSPTEAPGVGDMGTLTLNANIRFRNGNQARNINATAWLVPVYAGVFTIFPKDLQTFQSLSIVSKEQVLSSPVIPQLQVLPSKRVFGGKIGSKELLRGVERAYSIGRKGLKEVSSIAKDLQPIASLAMPLLKGGKGVSKKTLKDRLAQLEM